MILHSEIYEEDFGTGSCIAALRRQDNDTVARIYEGNESFYSIVNFPYPFKGISISYSSIAKEKKRNLPIKQSLKYALKIFEEDLLLQEKKYKEYLRS